MPKVIGVRFRTSPRVYYFAPTEGEEYRKDSKIVVETQRGVEMATVVLPVFDVDESKIVAPLKPVLRIATADDMDAVAMTDEDRREILSVAKEKIAARELDMKIVDCEYTVDRSKLVLYFTAEQRVDFRELVRDLASAFHNRIDLRQIGPRDECKLIGSLGACGMPCCCGRFESDSEHVSIKMAKNQNLALTPNKINGMCGRLLCCLAYENKTYEEIMRRMPKHNAVVTCPDGRRGTVVSVTPLTEKVKVKVGDGDNFEFAEYALSELNGKTTKEQTPSSDNATRTEPALFEDEQPQSSYDYIPEPPPERNRGNNNNKNKNKRNGNNRNNHNGKGNHANGNTHADESRDIDKRNNAHNNNEHNGDNNVGGNNNNKKRRNNRHNNYRKNKNNTKQEQGNNGGAAE